MTTKRRNHNLQKPPCCERGQNEDEAHQVEDDKTCQDVPENDDGGVDVDFGIGVDLYISLIIIMQYQDSPQIRMSRANHLKSGSCSCRYSLYQDHCLKNKKMWLMCLLLFLN